MKSDPMRAGEWKREIERKRGWLSLNRPEYEAAKEKINEEALSTLAEIANVMARVADDSPSNASVRAIAQCQAIFKPMYDTLRVIGDFERAREMVKKWDLEHAGEGE